MLGKTEGRRGGHQRMWWLDDIADAMAMNLGKFGEMVRPGEAWHAAVREGCKASMDGRLNNSKAASLPCGVEYLPWTVSTLFYRKGWSIGKTCIQEYNFVFLVGGESFIFKFPLEAKEHKWRFLITRIARWCDFTVTFHFHALEKEMAPCSSVLNSRIPGTGEPGGLPSVGSHRVGHDWSDLAAAAFKKYPRERVETSWHFSSQCKSKQWQSFSQVKKATSRSPRHPNLCIVSKAFAVTFSCRVQRRPIWLQPVMRWCVCIQSCPTLFDLMDCSLPGSSVHGIPQARILEWAAISYSRGSSWPWDRTRVSFVSYISGRFFTTGPPRKQTPG